MSHSAVSGIAVSHIAARPWRREVGGRPLPRRPRACLELDAAWSFQGGARRGDHDQKP